MRRSCALGFVTRRPGGITRSTARAALPPPLPPQPSKAAEIAGRKCPVERREACASIARRAHASQAWNETMRLPALQSLISGITAGLRPAVMRNGVNERRRARAAKNRDDRARLFENLTI